MVCETYDQLSSMGENPFLLLCFAVFTIITAQTICNLQDYILFISTLSCILWHKMLVKRKSLILPEGIAKNEINAIDLEMKMIINDPVAG